MECQKFKYKILENDGYTISTHNPEYDYLHQPYIKQDDYGHVITVYTELKFDYQDKTKIIQGQIVYFIPFDGQLNNNINKIIPELIYQSFCSQSGYVFAKYQVLIKTIPNVLTIYNEFMASEMKSK